MWQLAAGLLAGSCAVLSLPQALPVALVWTVPVRERRRHLRVAQVLAAGTRERASG